MVAEDCQFDFSIILRFSEQNSIFNPDCILMSNFQIKIQFNNSYSNFEIKFLF